MPQMSLKECNDSVLQSTGGIFLPACRGQEASGIRPMWKAKQKPPCKQACRLFSLGFPRPANSVVIHGGGHLLARVPRARSIGHSPDVESQEKTALQASLPSVFAWLSPPCELLLIIITVRKEDCNVRKILI